ncbi:MAG: aminomethyl-transferring glycine dehydrogenase subunit GcvPB, partial [Thermoanaerobaculia bacterium]
MTTVTETPAPASGSEAKQGTNRVGLIFERSRTGRRGYQLPALDVPEQDLARLIPNEQRRDEVAGEVEVSEVDVIRHFTRLSKLNVSIDAGLYPL